MSKKKKVKSELKHGSKRKQAVKGRNKHEKKRIKHFHGLSKIKNKQNIHDSALTKSKAKLSIKNDMSKSRNVQNSIVDIKSKHKQKIKTKGPGIVKSNNIVKRLNINKIKAMLNANESQVCIKSKEKLKVPLSLRERMLAQLKTSRFRFLNEQMYNNNSSESKTYFQNDPHAFYAYHEGYKQQVSRWPMNPLNVIIESICKMPKDYVIADFGCGEAELASSVPQTVHSFDLIAMNDKVKACDMAHTSLLTGRTNVVVFCLSLMGSNLGDYLLEANRVLDKNGILKIAEVESRFDKIDDFVKLMSHYGFVNTWKDLSNNLFYFLDFKKTKDVLKKDISKLPEITLKSCLYKKR